MLPENIQAVISANSEAFKSILDIFVRENSSKYDKAEQRIIELTTVVEDLRRSLEFSQKDLDDCKQRISNLEKDKQESDKTIADLKNELNSTVNRQNYMGD